MEPVTHFLTGACIGRSGLNRRTAYATLAATLAAEAPDIDTLWTIAGPVESFAHHRGITHTLVAAPFMALAVTGVVWLINRLSRTRKRAIITPQPVNWLWIFFTALIAHLSHLALDWTNNYGVRPFYPFNRHWYSGDIVFIAEPILWALLILALTIPALLGLTDRELGARRTQFRGRGWAIFALSAMVVLWGLRFAEHAHAINLIEASNVAPTTIRRVSAEPYPINPFRWHALIETELTWQTAEVDTRRGIVQSDPRTNSIFKPPYTPTLAFARNTRLGQVYLDWSEWPVVRDVGPQARPGHPAPDFPPNRPWTSVEFSDLRFAYSYLDTSMEASSNQQLDKTLAHAALTGWVYILDGKEEAGQFLDGREQK
jgi:inner membrane protein